MKGIFVLLVAFAMVFALEAVVPEKEPIFFDNFDNLDKWVVSTKPGFTGKWENVVPQAPAGYPNDKGLMVASPARKHAIIAGFPTYNIDLNKDSLIVQYEVRFQKSHQCGGAYLKITREDIGANFEDKTPYGIMFGPDYCGGNNKVHLILQYPVASGGYQEKHLTNPPRIKHDEISHLYTLVLSKNHYKVIIDGSVAKEGKLSTDFDPAIELPKTIEDPTDKKPATWDDRKQIPDPEKADAPEDWPVEFIADDTEIPEYWDEEEDGEWEAPMMPNPEFVPYTAPLIDNPDYMGEYIVQKIENPEYVEVDSAVVGPISGVGIDIWTMQDKILFDNVLITTHDSDRLLLEDYWKGKFDIESAAKREKEEADRKIAEEERKQREAEEALQKEIEEEEVEIDYDFAEDL
ncbi:hypothetical protein PCE1_000275 [Barthelona sp. PCE]